MVAAILIAIVLATVAVTVIRTGVCQRRENQRGG